MATKWNSWIYKPLTKIICLVLAVICLLGGSLLVANHFISERDYYSSVNWNITHANITQQEYAMRMLHNELDFVLPIARWGSEDNIKNPDNYDTNESRIKSLLSDNYYESSQNFDTIIACELQRFNNTLNEINNGKYDYYIETETATYGTKTDPHSYYGVITESQTNWYGPEGEIQTDFTRNNNTTRPYKIYLGTNAEEYEGARAAMLSIHRQQNTLILLLLLTGIAGLVAVLVLTLSSGRKYQQITNHVTLMPYDVFPLDLSLLGIIIATAIAIPLANSMLEWSYIPQAIAPYILAIVVVIFLALPLLLWYFSAVRNIKNKTFWSNLLVGKPFQYFGKYFGRFFTWFYSFNYKLKLFVYGIFIVIAGIICAIVPPMLLLFIPLLLLVLFVWLKHLSAIKNSVESIEEGNYNHKVPLKHGELASVARSLENIAANMDRSVQQELQSERYKTELITNVSHDLRTPLTSFITYTDLLKNKGLDSPEAPEYLSILIQKADRLKVLTDDLFEATKAASGNIDVHLETLNLTQLMNQWLGEFDEQISSSKLDFVVSMPEHAYISGDGRLLWRVLENLLSNVLKYSMTNTRVYITVYPTDTRHCLEIKNISNIGLNVPVEQLTNRFQRGDTARASEGSGLGLSIVQSFMTAQNGDLFVTVDGDLFKVAICLPQAPPPETAETEPTTNA